MFVSSSSSSAAARTSLSPSKCTRTVESFLLLFFLFVSHLFLRFSSSSTEWLNSVQVVGTNFLEETDVSVVLSLVWEFGLVFAGDMEKVVEGKRGLFFGFPRHN